MRASIPGRVVRGLLVTAIVIAGAVASGVFRPAESPARAAAKADAPELYGIGTPSLGQLSSASCAAAACHGGGQPGKTGSEHSTWAPDLLAGERYDPHSKAYRVLFGAASDRMAKALGVGAAHKADLCLKCHALDGVKPEVAVSEGVGCGSCHGPAEKWLAAHVEPGWKELSPRAKWEGYGFVPAGNLVARTVNCVRCHVGGGDRDVNHDLIAAGHPRLAFESVRFHSAPHYRTHWQEKTQDFEVRAWVIGQAATLRAATELLQARAERAARDDPRGVWPEFASYSCFACHQPVGDEGVRRDAGASARALGVPGWELWSNSAAAVAAKLSPDAFPGMTAPELREVAALRPLMEKRVPDARAVAAQAARAVAELDAWLVALQAAEERGGRVSPDAPRRFAHELAANALGEDRTRLADHDWDSLAANYLGCAAMHQGTRAPAWAAPIRGLEAELKIASVLKITGFKSPVGFGRKDRDRVRDLFRDLYDATAPTGDER